MTNWKNIPDYEGIYEVNDHGEVRTCQGKTTYTEKHGVRRWKQRIMKQKIDKRGYKRVSLWKDGKCKDWLVHRLVAMAFLEKSEGRDCVNHIDGNPSNNNLDNLEWCNYLENVEHAFDNRLNTSCHFIILLDKKTNDFTFFNSKAKASAAMGKNKGYISSKLKKGQFEFDGYEVFTKGGVE